MTKLWKKQSLSTTHPVVEAYSVGDDYWLDTKIIQYDIQGSRAHANMLETIGVLNADELTSLLNGLDSLSEKVAEDDIHITVQDEDCHTYIENFLVEQCGEAGKKIHTGRSRNDQILVTMRLYMKDQLNQVIEELKTLAEAFLVKAKEMQTIPFPGYTHTQQAMLSSVGHYYASFVEDLLDDVDFCKAAMKHINKNPLGSAAGFGVAFPLDREMTATELGFDSVQMNSIYCQTSRGKFESLVLEALYQVMSTLGRYAQDMLMYTSQEFAFFYLSDSVVTGSSIMPQKRNLDVMELLRANVGVVMGLQQTVKNIEHHLMSGYNRDLQQIKKPVLEAFQLVHTSLEVVGVVLEDARPHEKNIQSKISSGIFMADVANMLVKEEGMAFRDAYKTAAEKLEQTDIDYEENIASKISPGAPGNLRLEEYKERLLA